MAHQAAHDIQPECDYEYQPLPNARSARYMTLRPASSDNDPLVCSLYTAKLNQFPPYEAISYVWGTPSKDRSITCDGRIIRITANLFDALRQVRSATKPRMLWVDSICINQADVKERGHQVSLMGEIYKKSACTLICLGMSDQALAPIAADLVTNVDFMLQSIFGRADFSWEPKSFPFPEDGNPLLSDTRWESLAVLLQQPWFRRGWVVQEAALGQRAVILWAGTTIIWLKLLRAYFWAVFRALRVPHFHQLWMSNLHLESFYTQRNHEAITFRRAGAIQPLTLLEVLDSARWLEFTDPRDRIYAFLGLPNASELLRALRPSYEVPCFHVYRDLACEYMTKNQDADILHFVHHDDSSLESDVASWIPRWDMRLYSSYAGNLNNYSTSSRRILSNKSTPKMTVSQEKTTLELRATLIDSVAFTGPKFDKNSTTADEVASLWERVSSISGPTPYPCPPLRAFVEIFRCGVYRGPLKEWIVPESAYMRLLQQELTRGDASYIDALNFHALRMEDVHNKCFIVTNRGYHGLAPQPVQVGDICCIIYGTKSPFILRKTNRTSHHKLLGSALILSMVLDHNGNPMGLASDENCEDWVEWGLNEEDISLC